MSSGIPRLRMFAGPNGSGKSTLKEELPEGMMGDYVNADEIEKLIRKQRYFDLQMFQVEAGEQEILGYFARSGFLSGVGLLAQVQQLTFDDGKLLFDRVEVNSYFASVLSDFIRNKLLEAKRSFAFETVMSSADKVAFLKKAQECGFRTYLYYVSTGDPRINVDRVRIRVGKGGHPVPQDKIISRYHRSLDLLYDASQYSNRAYIFDNTFERRILAAEITNGEELEIKVENMPGWIKAALWDKFEFDDESA